MGNSVNEPRLDGDQRVIKSVKVASQTSLFAWYFQLSEFHNIPTQESLFQKQKWPASPLLCRQWRHSFLFFFNLFILLLAALSLCFCTGFSLSPCGERRFLLQFDGFSLWCLLLLQSTGSRARELQELQSSNQVKAEILLLVSMFPLSSPIHLVTSSSKCPENVNAHTCWSK